MAGLVTSLRGRRAVLVNAGGSHHGWIVWSENLGRSSDGWPTVDVVREEDWWRWVHTSRPPRRVTTWPAAAVGVEVP